jgi:phage gp29-like protein
MVLATRNRATILNLVSTRSQTQRPLSAVAVSTTPIPSIGGDVLPSLATILRPQSVGNWLMPYLSAITPTYIEGVLRGGLGGNHVAMFQLFDLMWDTDPEISSCISEYVTGVLNKKLVITPYAPEGEEPSSKAIEKAKLMSGVFRAMRPSLASDENGFREMCRDILAAPWLGTSLQELDWYDTYGDGSPFIVNLPEVGETWCPRAAYWVNPVCYGWDLNGRMGLRVKPEDVQRVTSTYKNRKVNDTTTNFADITQFINTSVPSRPTALVELPERKFLIGILKAKTGSVFSASWLRSLAWWWVAKNFCGDWLLNYAQIFGIPMRKATYPASAQEALKQEIRQMLQASASATWAMVPEGWSLEFDKAAGGGEGSPQGFLYAFADQQIRKVILHQTMMGGMHSRGSGVGKGGMETEMEGPKDDNIAAGADFVASVINYQFIPYVLTQNYGDGGDLEAPEISFVDNKVGGLIDAQRDQILTQVMDIGEDYMRRKYDIPAPGDDEAIAGQDMGSNGAQMQQQKQQMSLQKQQMAKAQQQDQNVGQSDEQLQDQADSKESARESAVESSSYRRKTLLARSRKLMAASADKALAETVQPLLKRLEAIKAISDAESQKTALQKFLKDLPALAKAMKSDNSLADAVTTDGVSSFVKGLASKAKGK